MWDFSRLLDTVKQWASKDIRDKEALDVNTRRFTDLDEISDPRPKPERKNSVRRWAPEAFSFGSDEGRFVIQCVDFRVLVNFETNEIEVLGVSVEVTYNRKGLSITCRTKLNPRYLPPKFDAFVFDGIVIDCDGPTFKLKRGEIRIYINMKERVVKTKNLDLIGKMEMITRIGEEKPWPYEIPTQPESEKLVLDEPNPSGPNTVSIH